MSQNVNYPRITMINHQIVPIPLIRGNSKCILTAGVLKIFLIVGCMWSCPQVTRKSLKGQFIMVETLQ